MFYTVRMKAKKLVSKFDEKGRKISDEEILIDQVYHDLPLQTAQGYLKNFPDNQVRIEAQPMELRRDPKIKVAGERDSYVPRADRAKIGGSGTKSAHVETPKRKTSAPSPTKLGGGDMTDALNKALEKA